MRDSLQHVARGADGILFFQWRASRAGAEKFHSGLVPHAGTDTRVCREVFELGAVLGRVAEVAGSRSAQPRGASCSTGRPGGPASSTRTPPSTSGTVDRAHAFHGRWPTHGVGVDVVHPDTDLAGYRVVVVPTLYSVTDAAAARIAEAAAAGATVVVTYFSGIVDEHDHVRLGGYPGAFRDLLGIRVEEFLPLRSGESVRPGRRDHRGRVDRGPAGRWTPRPWPRTTTDPCRASGRHPAHRRRRGGVVRRHPAGRRRASTRWSRGCSTRPAYPPCVGAARRRGHPPVRERRPLLGVRWSTTATRRSRLPVTGYDLVSDRPVPDGRWSCPRARPPWCGSTDAGRDSADR